MTRQDRLNAIIAKLNPGLAADHATSGSWPNGAPYTVEGPGPLPGLAAGLRRVKVTGTDGDVVAGVGPTVEAAIAALAKKVGLADDPKGSK